MRKLLVLSLVGVLGIITCYGTYTPISKYQGDILCTGSMDPTITCLDSVYVITNPTVESINLGSVIFFDTAGTECSFLIKTILHRVIAMKYGEKGIEYRTKGDHNTTPDECWIPFENVWGIVVKVEKGASPEGQVLLEQIWRIQDKQMESLIWIQADTAEVDGLRAQGADVHDRVVASNKVVDEFNLGREQLRISKVALQNMANPRYTQTIEKFYR